MTHYHVKVKGEVSRETGALATTREAALREAEIDNEGNKTRSAHIVLCDKDCFGSRAR